MANVWQKYCIRLVAAADRCPTSTLVLIASNLQKCFGRYPRPCGFCCSLVFDRHAHIRGWAPVHLITFTTRLTGRGAMDHRYLWLGGRCNRALSSSRDQGRMTGSGIVCWRLLRDFRRPGASRCAEGRPEFGSSAASPCLPSSAGRSRYFLDFSSCAGAPGGVVFPRRVVMGAASYDR